jgi:hypothetical protein
MSISKIGAEFVVNTTTADAQYASSVTAFDQDSFFVAFANGTGLVYPAQRISGQRIDSDGTPIGGEVVLAPSTLDSGDPNFPTNIHGQERPELARLADGTVVAVWEDARGDGTSELRWRFIDGTSQDSEGTLVSDIGDSQIDAAIAPLADGGFVMSWSVQGGSGVDEYTTACSTPTVRCALPAVSSKAASVVQQEHTPANPPANRRGGTPRPQRPARPSWSNEAL